MSEPERGRTEVFYAFAGRKRRFQLRLGEVEELERLAGAGVGEIALRLSTHRFKLADVRETIRLGLQGGGASETDATALVMSYVDDHPLTDNIGLAAKIISAFNADLPPSERGKEPAESDNGPATSPPSTEPGARLDTRHPKSEE